MCYDYRMSRPLMACETRDFHNRCDPTLNANRLDEKSAAVDTSYKHMNPDLSHSLELDISFVNTSVKSSNTEVYRVAA